MKTVRVPGSSLAIVLDRADDTQFDDLVELLGPDIIEVPEDRLVRLLDFMYYATNMWLTLDKTLMVAIDNCLDTSGVSTLWP